jgi:hypothetical protein|nr:hypothetical protein [Neorhizobium tomejilense]
MAEDRFINKNFGVVLFDDPKQPEAGWKATAGINKTERIKSPDELSTGTIWLTNIDYNDFFRGSSEIWRRSNLRHESYLVVKMANILKEWNYDPGRAGQASQLAPSFICQFISQVFHRIMHSAFRLIRQVDPRLTMDRAFMGQTLRDDIRVILPPMDYPKSEAASFMKTDQAWQEFTQCTTRPMRDSVSVMVRRPRTLHAMEMLQTPIPLGPFEPISRRNFRTYGSDIVEFLKDTDKPCMVELDVEGIDPEIGPVYGFSNSTNKQAKASRSWVAHNEFEVLSRYANLSVRSFYMGREYGSLVGKLPDAVQEFLTDKTLDSSWTAGVIAETIWRAATLKEASSQAGKATDGEDRAGTSWEGAWIRGQDKISMFIPALALSKRNYSISSYGLGWVQARVTEEMRTDFINDALSLGLVPAMNDVPDGLFHQEVPVQWGGDIRSKVFAQYQATKNIKMLWNLDKLPTMPPGERKNFIRQLIQMAAREG